MRFNIIDIDACVVCLHLTANGEYNDGTDAARDCERGQRDKWGDNARHFVCGGNDEWDGDLGFSRSECEGCGNPYHGDRFRLHVMIPLDKIRTGRDGRMYVSSADGSYVEVWQGTEYLGCVQRGYRNVRKLYRATRVWADGFGRWHATVPVSGQPLRDANKARRLIIAALSEREGPRFDPRRVRVSRGEFSHQDTVVEYAERA